MTLEFLENDRVAQTISDTLAGFPKRLARQTGFSNICCPMCVSRGETPDRKYRCGVISNGGGTIVTCFNCGFKSGYRMGGILGRQLREFMAAIGVPRREIKRLGLWAEQVRVAVQTCPEAQARLPSTPDFQTARLPEGTESLETWADRGCTNSHFLATVEYLLSRGDAAVAATTYYWTDSPEHNLHRSVIIPCHQGGRMVGWTARYIDPGRTRYYKETPSNILFNIDKIHAPNRAYLFLVEGVFDALVLEGVAPLGATLNTQQIGWINQSDKIPVVVPDRDTAGERLIEIAIQQGWAVAAPHYGRHQWWDPDIKDADEAVKRYGKLYTVQSILSTMTTDANQIRLRSSYRIT